MGWLISRVGTFMGLLCLTRLFGRHKWWVVLHNVVYPSKMTNSRKMNTKEHQNQTAFVFYYKQNGKKFYVSQICSLYFGAFRFSLGHLCILWDCISFNGNCFKLTLFFGCILFACFGGQWGRRMLANVIGSTNESEVSGQESEKCCVCPIFPLHLFFLGKYFVLVSGSSSPALISFSIFSFRWLDEVIEWAPCQAPGISHTSSHTPRHTVGSAQKEKRKLVCHYLYYFFFFFFLRLHLFTRFFLWGVKGNLWLRCQLSHRPSTSIAVQRSWTRTFIFHDQRMRQKGWEGRILSSTGQDREKLHHSLSLFFFRCLFFFLLHFFFFIDFANLTFLRITLSSWSGANKGK